MNKILLSLAALGFGGFFNMGNQRKYTQESNGKDKGFGRPSKFNHYREGATRKKEPKYSFVRRTSPGYGIFIDRTTMEEHEMRISNPSMASKKRPMPYKESVYFGLITE
jgi:hypothetical protein